MLKEWCIYIFTFCSLGKQSTSNCASSCCLFATRKMQCYSGKEIQRRKVSQQYFNILSMSKYSSNHSCFFCNYLKHRHPELAAVCQDDRTLILYPGPKSQNLEELVRYQEVGTVKHSVIIIDGTWSQAKNMFLKNSMFHLPKQVCTAMFSGISGSNQICSFNHQSIFTESQRSVPNAMFKSVCVELNSCLSYMGR